jgi:hypothetical protein
LRTARAYIRGHSVTSRVWSVRSIE